MYTFLVAIHLLLSLVHVAREQGYSLLMLLPKKTTTIASEARWSLTNQTRYCKHFAYFIGLLKFIQNEN